MHASCSHHSALAAGAFWPAQPADLSLCTQQMSNDSAYVGGPTRDATHQSEASQASTKNSGEAGYCHLFSKAVLWNCCLTVCTGDDFSEPVTFDAGNSEGKAASAARPPSGSTTLSRNPSQQIPQSPTHHEGKQPSTRGGPVLKQCIMQLEQKQFLLQEGCPQAATFFVAQQVCRTSYDAIIFCMPLSNKLAGCCMLRPG